MGNVFDVLESIQRRPSMYLGYSDDERAEQLRCLDDLLAGYRLALIAHGLNEPGVNLLTQIEARIRERFGWSTSRGPIAAILEHVVDPREGWELFWALVAEERYAI